MLELPSSNPNNEQGTLDRELVPNMKLMLRLVLFSFEHSQGDKLTQQKIFQYIAQAFPHWRLSDAMRIQLFEMVFPIASKIVLNQSRHYKRENVFNVDVMAELKVLEYFLNKSHKHEKNKIIPDLTEYMVHRDWEYIVKRSQGREYRSHHKQVKKTYSPQTDPFFSYVCYYALESHTTGLGIFDSLYMDIKAFLQNNYQHLRPSTCSELIDVMKVYLNYDANFKNDPLQNILALLKLFNKLNIKLFILFFQNIYICIKVYCGISIGI